MSGQPSGPRVQEGAKDTRKKMAVSTASVSFKKPWKRVNAAVPPSSSLGREGRRRENRGGLVIKEGLSESPETVMDCRNLQMST